ncbi:MAG: bifunctional pyr operon transcriptional regulator/uracil phosphoribosyltransferase [Phycisphaerales bacterium]|nr:bifunctional pyr operon transcriptional regulator/uracil phosphoribosyltransferase [Phycisphaerales bacterium]
MRIIADAIQIERLIFDLAQRIASDTPIPERLAFIGIRRRGDVLATRLAKVLSVHDVGSIDITLYRDDLSETGPAARVGRTDIPFAIEGRDVVLVDDVVMTGRSSLAGIREIVDFGRPARLRLAVLVERPERELPIHPEFAALRVRPGPEDKVDVRLLPQDDMDRISINPRG